MQGESWGMMEAQLFPGNCLSDIESRNEPCSGSCAPENNPVFSENNPLTAAVPGGMLKKGLRPHFPGRAGMTEDFLI